MILTIICPTFNEEKHIDKTIESFLSQQCNSFSLEVLICDGMSTDRTREIVSKLAEKNHRIKLIDNPNKRTPFAFNIGLNAANGDYVAILGAHAIYQVNYLEVCFRELIDKDAVGCSGKIITQSINNAFQPKLCEWISLSWFGVSGNSFRLKKEGYVETIGYPIFRKKALLDLNGYNEKLLRNQDNDMNQRLIDAGHKLYLTSKTSCTYRPPNTIKNLLIYAYNNGFWVAKSFFIHRNSMKLHHFIPFLFSSMLLLLIIGSFFEYFVGSTNFIFIILSSLFLLHLTLGLISSIIVKEKKFMIPRTLLMPLIFLAFHFSYGWGTIKGFLSQIFNNQVFK